MLAQFLPQFVITSIIIFRNKALLICNLASFAAQNCHLMIIQSSFGHRSVLQATLGMKINFCLLICAFLGPGSNRRWPCITSSVTQDGVCVPLVIYCLSFKQVFIALTKSCNQKVCGQSRLQHTEETSNNIESVIKRNSGVSLKNIEATCFIGWKTCHD